jgi:hypothetical protein
VNNGDKDYGDGWYGIVTIKKGRHAYYLNKEKAETVPNIPTLDGKVVALLKGACDWRHEDAIRKTAGKTIAEMGPTASIVLSVSCLCDCQNNELSCTQ